MTEQEAIKYLKDANRNNQMIEVLPKSDIGKCLINALEEVHQYRVIGTPEECQAAVEKKRAKKVIKYADGTEHCPVCDCDNSCIGYGVCIDCGQKLDWSEEE